MSSRFAEWIRNSEYDSVIAKKTNEYVVYDPEQIKSADTVTYDDNGNIIPLSERFNKDNNDIRYSNRQYKNQAYKYTENDGIIETSYDELLKNPELSGLKKPTYNYVVNKIKHDVDYAFEHYDNVIYTDFVDRDGYVFVYENFDDVNPQLLSVFKKPKGVKEYAKQISEATDRGSSATRFRRGYSRGYSRWLEGQISNYIYDGLSPRLSNKRQTKVNESLRRNLEKEFSRTKLFQGSISRIAKSAFRELIDSYLNDPPKMVHRST